MIDNDDNFGHQEMSEIYFTNHKKTFSEEYTNSSQSDESACFLKNKKNISGEFTDSSQEGKKNKCTGCSVIFEKFNEISTEFDFLNIDDMIQKINNYDSDTLKILAIKLYCSMYLVKKQVKFSKPQTPNSQASYSITTPIPFEIKKKISVWNIKVNQCNTNVNDPLIFLNQNIKTQENCLDQTEKCITPNENMNATSEEKSLNPEEDIIQQSNETFLLDQQNEKNARINILHENENDKENEDMILNDYILINEISSGSQGIVYLAINNKFQNFYAIKEIKVRNLKFYKAKYESLIREISIMRYITSENIVKLHEVIEDKKKKLIYLVMDYISNGHIIKCIDTDNNIYEILPDDKIYFYTKQIINGLNELHQRNIIHRDLKPENILLDENDIVYLSDFGISESSTKNNSAFEIGTKMYMAPELFIGTNYNTAIDVWALGIIIFLMMFGYFPFFGEDATELKNNIIHSQPKYPSTISETQKDFFDLIFRKDHVMRIKLNKIIHHKMFVEINEKNTSLYKKRNTLKYTEMLEFGINMPDINTDKKDVNSDSINEIKKTEDKYSDSTKTKEFDDDNIKKNPSNESFQSSKNNKSSNIGQEISSEHSDTQNVNLS